MSDKKKDSKPKQQPVKQRPQIPLPESKPDTRDKNPPKKR